VIAAVARLDASCRSSSSNGAAAGACRWHHAHGQHACAGPSADHAEAQSLHSELHRPAETCTGETDWWNAVSPANSRVSWCPRKATGRCFGTSTTRPRLRRSSSSRAANPSICKEAHMIWLRAPTAFAACQHRTLCWTHAEQPRAASGTNPAAPTGIWFHSKRSQRPRPGPLGPHGPLCRCCCAPPPRSGGARNARTSAAAPAAPIILCDRCTCEM
jgi:hypothetical protein